MDQEIEIISSETRKEKIKNFFINNKNKLISLIIFLIIIVISVYSFDKYTVNKKADKLLYPLLK